MSLNIISDSSLVRETIKSINLKHIAVIMDGNRRWAKEKGLASMFGHKEGVKSLKRTIKAADEFGIKYLTVYAFSTENWGRNCQEVDFLMHLLKETISNELKEMHENNIKVRIIGNLNPLGKNLKKVLDNAENITRENTGLNLQIAINYGSRNEITNAVKRICQDVQSGNISNIDDVDDKTISSHLYTAEIPDPDLLIRTGGEQRISNYLLWQLAYTEIYVTETFWPDFDRETLIKAINIFAGRSRRYGGD